jgi:hypothetical protein
MLTPLQNFQMLQVFKFILYQVAFWFGVACAGLGLLLLVLFVKIGRAKSDLAVEEKAELYLS